MKQEDTLYRLGIMLAANRQYRAEQTSPRGRHELDRDAQYLRRQMKEVAWRFNELARSK